MAGKTTTRPATIGQIMTREPVCISASASARELAHLLEANEISGVPVVNVQMQVIGVISMTDLLHRCVTGPLGSRPGTFFEKLAEGMDSDSDFDPENLGTVEEFMSPDPVTATVNDPISAVARRMADEGVHRVIVVDEGKHVVGIVTTLDILKIFPD